MSLPCAGGASSTAAQAVVGTKTVTRSVGAASEAPLPGTRDRQADCPLPLSPRFGRRRATPMRSECLSQEAATGSARRRDIRCSDTPPSGDRSDAHDDGETLPAKPDPALLAAVAAAKSAVAAREVTVEAARKAIAANQPAAQAAATECERRCEAVVTAARDVVRTAEEMVNAARVRRVALVTDDACRADEQKATDRTPRDCDGSLREEPTNTDVDVGVDATARLQKAQDLLWAAEDRFLDARDGVRNARDRHMQAENILRACLDAPEDRLWAAEDDLQTAKAHQRDAEKRLFNHSFAV